MQIDKCSQDCWPLFFSRFSPIWTVFIYVHTKKILFVVCGFAEIFANAKTLRCHWHHRDKNDSSNFLRFFSDLNRQFHKIFDTVFVLWLKMIFDSSYKLFEEAQGFVDNVLVGDFYIHVWKKSLLLLGVKLTSVTDTTEIQLGSVLDTA